MATRSLLAAVSGIEANQSYLDEIGNNIANADTVGYKSGTVEFGDLLAEQIAGATAPTTGSGGVNPVAIGSGVRVTAVATQLAEGSLETTGNPTDVAITGSGYLVVQQGGRQLYTRDGQLTLDAKGNLTTSTGALVEGWTASATGAIQTAQPLGPITIPKGETNAAQPTSSMTIGGNLPAWSGTGTVPTAAVTIDGYDSLGNTVPVDVTFTGVTGKPNEWSISASSVAPTGAVTHLFATGSPPIVTFTPTSGKVKTITGATVNATGSFTLPVTTMPGGYTFPATDKLSLDFAAPGSSNALTQFAGSNTLTKSQNGYASGALETYSIGSNGVITASFSNGRTMAIGKIALAAFTNPAGLVTVGNGLLAASPNSGTASIGAAGTGIRGKLLGGELEQSNVNIATQLTDLITAQEAYQANTKVISTSQQVIAALEALP